MTKCHHPYQNPRGELPRDSEVNTRAKLVEILKNRNRGFCCCAGGRNFIREYPR
jgi:hypothetical protein